MFFGFAIVADQARAEAPTVPQLHLVQIDAATAVAGETRILRYAAHAPGGLGRVSASFRAQYGAGILVEAAQPSWGEIRFDIREGHLDGRYRLETLYIEDAADPANWVIHERDGSLRGPEGDIEGGHEVRMYLGDFAISGNGTVDRIAPRLLSILREGAGHYRYDALDDGTGVVSLSVEITDPQGRPTAAMTRAPGNRGYASLQLMHGAPTGLYRVERIRLRDGASPANVTTYHRDGSVVSNDPSVPQSHAMDLTALDFHWGDTPPVSPELLAVRSEGEGVFSYRAASPAGIAGADLLIRLPDGTADLARSLASGATGTAVLPLGAQRPTGTYRVEAVRLRDAASPAGFTEYRRDGSRIGPALSVPESHDFDLAALDFDWWGGPLGTETRLTVPPRIRLGQEVEAQIAVTSLHGTPQGWLHLHNGEAVVMSTELDPQGRAELTLADLSIGTHRLTARYSGSAQFQGSVSPERVLLVEVDALTVPGFIGGGVIFAQSAGCNQYLGAEPHAVTVRYGPSELGGAPSGVTIAWREGAEHLALWGDLVPGELFMGGAGRSIWGRFVFAAQIPLIRVVQRQVTQPENAQIALAQELVLRLRVQNFAATPGCAVTLTASLRRTH